MDKTVFMFKKYISKICNKKHVNMYKKKAIRSWKMDENGF